MNYIPFNMNAERFIKSPKSSRDWENINKKFNNEDQTLQRTTSFSSRKSRNPTKSIGYKAENDNILKRYIFFSTSHLQGDTINSKTNGKNIDGSRIYKYPRSFSTGSSKSFKPNADKLLENNSDYLLRKPRVPYIRNDIKSLKSNNIIVETNNKEKKCHHKDNEKPELKNQFIALENCCCELLLNSKYSNSNAYKTALNFYKLILAIYHSTKEINKDFFVSEKEFIDHKYKIEKKEKSLVEENEKKLKNVKISNTSDIVSDLSSKKIKDKTFLSNKEPLKNDIKLNKRKENNVKEKFYMKNVEDFNIDHNLTLKVDNDKLLLRNLLKLPKIYIKSKSIVKAYKGFVEEQYLISAFRSINNEEIINLPVMEECEEKSPADKIKKIITGCKIPKNIKKYLDQSTQISDTKTKNNFSMVDMRTKFSQTNSLHNSNIFPLKKSQKLFKNHDLKTDTSSWLTDTLSDDSRIGSKGISSLSYKYPLNDSTKSEIKIGKLVVCNQICIDKIMAVDNNIPELVVSSVRGSVVRQKYNNVIECLDCPNPSIGFLITYDNNYYAKKEKLCDSYSMNLKENASNTFFSSYNPFTHSSKSVFKANKEEHREKLLRQKEADYRDIQYSSDKSIPTSADLNNLYEILTKLQNIFESPGEKKVISTQNVTDSTDSNFLEIKESHESPLFINSLGDACEDVGVLNLAPDYYLNSQLEILNSSQSTNDKVSSKEKIPIKSLNEDLSETTSSISMLENLIDEFLTKNGVTNISDT